MRGWTRSDVRGFRLCGFAGKRRQGEDCPAVGRACAEVAESGRRPSGAASESRLLGREFRRFDPNSGRPPHGLINFDTFLVDFDTTPNSEGIPAKY